MGGGVHLLPRAFYFAVLTHFSSSDELFPQLLMHVFEDRFILLTMESSVGCFWPLFAS